MNCSSVNWLAVVYTGDLADVEAQPWLGQRPDAVEVQDYHLLVLEAASQVRVVETQMLLGSPQCASNATPQKVLALTAIKLLGLIRVSYRMVEQGEEGETFRRLEDECQTSRRREGEALEDEPHPILRTGGGGNQSPGPRRAEFEPQIDLPPGALLTHELLEWAKADQQSDLGGILRKAGAAEGSMVFRALEALLVVLLETCEELRDMPQPLLDPLRRELTIGDRALHVATRCQHKAIGKWLVERGADVGAANRKGKSPADLAVGTPMEMVLQKAKPPKNRGCMLSSKPERREGCRRAMD